jgi:four helix bundle protein
MKQLTFAKSYQELAVYKASFRFQQAVFRLSKSFPKEETYSLTDQIRRSSRSIGANLAEGWSKRPYPAHFLSKLTDADGELQETLHWLRTAYSCDYVERDLCSQLVSQAKEIGKMLGSMITNHLHFCPGAAPH